MPLNSTKTAIKLLNELHPYFPKIDDKPLPMRVGGDGATFVMLHAAKSLKTASAPSQTLHFIWPSSSASGLHRSMARTGRMFKIFAPSNMSQDSPVSLFHIRSTQGHKSATSKVTESYNHCYELAEAIMHGIGSLILMKHLGIESLDEKPSSFDLEAAVNSAVDATVDEILFNVSLASPSSIKVCSKCSSKVVRGLTTCGCEYCPNWIHTKCAISNDSSGSMGVKKVRQKKQLHFCSGQCSDRKYSYALSLLHFCMQLKARRDACRHNDAERMLLHNKQDLEFFFLNGNTQYTRICHHLIVGQNGSVPANIAFDEKHNCSMSLHGGAGKNIPLDHGNECKFGKGKGKLKKQSGRPSIKSTLRRTKLGQSAVSVHEGLQNMSPQRCGQSHHSTRLDVDETKQFIAMYKDEKLVQNLGSRAHWGCENYGRASN
ncbi:hypothetical protein Fcan01_15325 [Folsomia candida]|uniref:DUF6589 domain-containing protein n=1 Tax=Folsomia candida TaxID=158441 RepID=A0A226DWU0_FOLCA|nr:hypothetical protein Fcan01_15325 [Folsomia candida]